MKQVLICREFPPVAHPAGGIGTYAKNIARLLAESGETVHVIGQRWSGAPKDVEEFCQGRLIVHRIQLEPEARDILPGEREARALFATSFPAQAFGWRASLLTERLVETEGVDLIEAQEWEAPLYYFQLRRALGLGPAKQPPCIVHLHSPTEFIVLHNDWNPDRPDYLTSHRLEDYSIAAADGWLCPSRFLARAAEARYGLGRDVVRVIPLPLGGTAPIIRAHQTWRDGSVLYVGRMEPRKGVLEWIAGAVRVAGHHPRVTFEFVGSDLPYSDRQTVQERALELIPADLRSRFIFHGEQPKSELPRFLAGARMAVVPSRWENFPNTCVEAMGSGLPVIATRQGGMAEMVEDGETGWLADDAVPEQLATVLERALATEPDRLAEMGERARTSISRMCDDSTIVAAQRSFREAQITRGAHRSTRVPCGSTRRTPEGESSGGMAVLVERTARDGRLAECLAALGAQTTAPRVVIVAGPIEPEQQSLANAVPVISVPRESGDNGLTLALETARKSGPLLGYIFLDDLTIPEPGLVRAYGQALESQPDTGVVTCWGSMPDPLMLGPCPTFPFQLLANQAGAAVALRRTALEPIGPLAGDSAREYALWAAINRIMANGWTAITYPAPLLDTGRRDSARSPDHWRQWTRVLQCTPQELERNATRLLMLLGSELDRLKTGVQAVPREHTASPRAILQLPGPQRKAVFREIIRRPGRAAWRIIWLTKHAIYRQTRRLVGWPKAKA
jgi:glycogen synthase